MDWLRAAERLRSAREAGVMVTVLEVRGHAPREPGAKMVVSGNEAWGTIGGGSLEATALERARLLIAQGASAPERLDVRLTEHPTLHGTQCCGGEITLILEPLPVAPSVAIFGAGHVGLELARILARHDLDLHLVDSRPGRLSAEVLAPLIDAVARVSLHGARVPESVLDELPPGSHVLVLTHDHAEDAAICDAALRCDHLASIGLIGSSAKWRRFQRTLADVGHTPESIARIHTPIGLRTLRAKDPATTALGIAIELLHQLQTRGMAPISSDRRVVRDVMGGMSRDRAALPRS